MFETCRTPRGVRGLKSEPALQCVRDGESHPSRGAWIEIRDPACPLMTATVAPLAGCVD